VWRECLDRARHAVTARATQFDEIFGPRNSDEKTAIVAQYTPEFPGIHPRRD
jgi:hypothetical protein